MTNIVWECAPLHTLQCEVVYCRDMYSCVLCGETRKAYLTRDHIIPQCMEGTHFAHNIITLCRKCNSSKLHCMDMCEDLLRVADYRNSVYNIPPNLILYGSVGNSLSRMRNVYREIHEGICSMR